MSETADTPVCPCDVFCHPKAPYNPAGHLSLAYRVGDFASFRHALLKPLPKEEALAAWRPGAHGDLAVQIVEWWAYLADVLTFYNERVVNESYLRTALLDESVRRLIRVLGYRPRPGIGARGTLAALSSSPVPFSLPKGFPAGSKPAPGKDPQVFELDADTTVAPGGAVAVTPAPGPVLSGSDTDTQRDALLKGVVNTVKTGDQLLLLRDDWPGNASAYALAAVQSVQPERAPDGKKNTRVSMKLDRTLPAPASNTTPGHRLLKATQTAHPWHDASHTAKVFDGASVHLDSLSRSLQVGDPVLFESSVPGLTDTLVHLTQYQEVVWYANPKSPATPDVPPTTPDNVVPVPIPHAVLTMSPTLSGDWNSNAGAVLLRFAWQEVGEPIATPASSVKSSDAPIKPAQPLPVTAGAPVLVEDATGAGAQATADDPSSVRLKESPGELQAPLRALVNLLPVSRGQTVRE